MAGTSGPPTHQRTVSRPEPQGNCHGGACCSAALLRDWGRWPRPAPSWPGRAAIAGEHRAGRGCGGCPRRRGCPLLRRPSGGDHDGAPGPRRFVALDLRPGSTRAGVRRCCGCSPTTPPAHPGQAGARRHRARAGPGAGPADRHLRLRPRPVRGGRGRGTGAADVAAAAAGLQHRPARGTAGTTATCCCRSAPTTPSPSPMPSGCSSRTPGASPRCGGPAGFRRAHGSREVRDDHAQPLRPARRDRQPRAGTPDFDRVVWVGEGPAWTARHAVVLRRIGMDLETWDAVDRVGREDIRRPPAVQRAPR